MRMAIQSSRCAAEVRSGTSSGRFIAGALSCIVVVGLSACGSDGSQTGSGGSHSANVPRGLQGMYQKAVDAGDDEVVVYTPLSTSWSSVFEAFSDDFPKIQVKTVQTVGAKLDSRLRQETASKQYRADLVMTGNTGMLALSKDDFFAPYQPKGAKAILTDPYYSLKDHSIYGVSAAVRGIIVNKNKLKQRNITVNSWKDLTNPALKGHMMMTDPTTDGGGLELMTFFLNDTRYGRDYVAKLAKQDIAVTSTTSECNNAVARGRYALCLNGTLAYADLLAEKGAPVNLVYPNKGGNYGTYFFAGILKHAPHSAAAKLLVSWLYTARAEKLKVASGHSPLRKTTIKADFPFLYEVPRLKRIKLDRIPAQQASALKFVNEQW